MSKEEIKSNLCYYDPENPNNNLDAYDEEDRPQSRNGCRCDNCFYGRDKLAMQILETQRERDEAREDRDMAQRYALDSDHAYDLMVKAVDEAREEVEHWKDSLKLLGETPEQVFESWRIRHTKMFNYIRIMTVWREKYNISKRERDNAMKEAEYYRERYNQLKDELKS